MGSVDQAPLSRNNGMHRPRTTQRTALIIGMVALAVVGYCSFRSRLYKPPKDWSPYFQELARECQKRQSPNCCMASLGAMVKGNYRLAPSSGCPAGYVGNMAKCIDSYRWCEATVNSNPQAVQEKK